MTWIWNNLLNPVARYSFGTCITLCGYAPEVPTYLFLTGKISDVQLVQLMSTCYFYPLCNSEQLWWLPGCPATPSLAQEPGPFERYLLNEADRITDF